MKIEIDGHKLRMQEVFLYLANEGHEVKLWDECGNLLGWRKDKTPQPVDYEIFSEVQP
jgi:hypothetical protein